MIDKDDMILGVFLLAILASGPTGAWIGVQYVKREAFDRGYMVECIGKSGYYWECEDE